MKIITKLTLVGAVALLTACGSSEPGRVQGGAATGAATGATVGLVGGPVGVVVGAVVGGGAGAIAGAAPLRTRSIWANLCGTSTDLKST
jgi:hypothetical protein